MAIDKYFLKSAVRVLNKIRRDYRTNVATLGYPDLMVSETDLKNVGINLNKLEIREKFVDTSMHKWVLLRLMIRLLLRLWISHK